jgi:two-component system phosphate regulon sensor histidine kinase PhoR
MTGNLAIRGAVIGGAAAIAAALVVGLAAGLGAAWPAVLVLALAGATAAAWMGHALLRESQRAVSDVVAASGRLPEADFAERVRPAGGPAAELTHSFNTMAGRVQELFAEVTAEHARLEAVFDASADAIVALSDDTTVRFLNPAALAMLGTLPEAALGRPLIEAVRDYELDALVRRAAASAEGAETEVITYGTARTPMRAAAVPVPQGGEWGVVLILTDLTEVTRVDHVRRDFLSNVSHELRTPLASIRALAETLEAGDVDPGAETEEFIRRIRQQVDRMTTLVNELLDLSRIVSGAVSVVPEPIDLAALVAESASLMRQRAESEGVTIVAPQDHGLCVDGDRASLLRVVNNLLDNAIKYSPRGSTIAVEVRDEGELVAVAVRDDGPGIPQPELGRVFERFYKGDASRTQTAAGGVGLGLAIVKHVVRLHGGTVEVVSEPGDGATFTVRLPRHFAGGRAGRKAGAVETPSR